MTTVEKFAYQTAFDTAVRNCGEAPLSQHIFGDNALAGLFAQIDGTIDGARSIGREVTGIRISNSLMKLFEGSPNSTGLQKYRGIPYAMGEKLYPQHTVEVVFS